MILSEQGLDSHMISVWPPIKARQIQLLNEQFLPLPNHHFNAPDTLYLIQFLQSVGRYLYWGAAFAATNWVTLTPLAIVIKLSIRFSTTTTTCLLPEFALVYVFTTLKP